MYNRKTVSNNTSSKRIYVCTFVEIEKYFFFLKLKHPGWLKVISRKEVQNISEIKVTHARAYYKFYYKK